MDEKRTRLLVLDDDRAHGESLTDLLVSKGYEAYFAATVDDATWLMGLFRFDLAILDYDMPGLTGPEAARQLRERDPGLRAILMSARRPEEAVDDETEPLPFVPKPIRVEDLVGLIASLRAQEQGTSIVVRVDFPLELYARKRR